MMRRGLILVGLVVLIGVAGSLAAQSGRGAGGRKSRSVLRTTRRDRPSWFRSIRCRARSFRSWMCIAITGPACRVPAGTPLSERWTS